MLNAWASTRTGPPGDLGTEVLDARYLCQLWAVADDTTDKSIGFGLFCSRFNDHDFSSIWPSSSWRVTVGMSSDSLCTLTFDSRIL